MSNPNSDLSQQQILQGSYDEAGQALRVETLGTLVPGEYDSIAASYPSANVEVYMYYAGGLSGTLVSTVTVTYTDSTKATLVSVVRTPEV